MNEPLETTIDHICPKCKKLFPERPHTLYGAKEWCTRCNSSLGHYQRSDEELKKKMIASGVPLRFSTILRGSESLNVGKIVYSAIENHQPLFLHGPVCTGKTLALAMFTNSLLHRNVPVFFMVCSETANRLRSNHDQLDQFYQRATTAGHLMLDDIGSENDTTGWWRGWLGDVVNYRYNNFLPTSASTNIHPTKLDPRLARRLTECNLVVEMK